MVLKKILSLRESKLQKYTGQLVNTFNFKATSYFIWSTKHMTFDSEIYKDVS
jgi:hypothetical protein